MRPSTSRFVHPYFTVYSSDAVHDKQFARIGFTPLYTTLTCLEPSFNTTVRSLHRDAAIFWSWHLQPSSQSRTAMTPRTWVPNVPISTERDIKVWRGPVHCSLFFQHRHDACTIAGPNHTYRTHFSFYAGTLIGALPQCAIRKLYRSSRSTSHRSNIEFFPLAWLEQDCTPYEEG